MNPLRTVREARINFIFFQDIMTCVMGILILVTLMMSLSLGEAATPQEQQIETELRQAKESVAELERQNQSAQEQKLAAAALPDRSTLETEVEVLRRQTANVAEQRRESEKAAAALKTQEERAALQRQALTNLQQSLVTLENQMTVLSNELVQARQTNAVYIVPAADAAQSQREAVALIVSGGKVQLQRMNGSGREERRLVSGEADLRSLLAPLNPTREYVVFYFRPSGAKWFSSFRDLARSMGLTVGYDAVEEQQEIIFSRP